MGFFVFGASWQLLKLFDILLFFLPLYLVQGLSLQTARTVLNEIGVGVLARSVSSYKTK